MSLKINIEKFIKKIGNNFYLIDSCYLNLDLSIMIKRVNNYLNNKSDINFFKLLDEPVRFLLLFDHFSFIEELELKNLELYKVHIKSESLNNFIEKNKIVYDGIFIISEHFSLDDEKIIIDLIKKNKNIPIFISSKKFKNL